MTPRFPLLPLAAASLMGLLASMATGQTAEIPDSALLLRLDVTSSTGRPLAGVEIRLDDEVIGQTDALGEFCWPRKPLKPGRYKLVASLRGYLNGSLIVTIPPAEQGLPLKLKLELREGEAPGPPQVGVKKPNYQVYQVFYATDRKQGNLNDAEQFYIGERNSTGQLELGICNVSIPAHHTAGVVESPSWIRLEFHLDPEKHVIMYTPRPLDHDKFYGRLSDRIRHSSRKEAFVFIHGYNTRFADATKRAAQLAADLGFDGAPIVYSWPSRGTFGGYWNDQGANAWTVPHLRAFLEEVAKQSGAERVHLIAHSMGNRALTQALNNITLNDSADARPHFNHIVLAAPDVRVTVMKSLAQAMVPLGQKITLYGSQNDDALLIAKILDGVARAGQNVRDLVIPGIEAVDASAVRTDFIGHGYLVQSPSIIADLKQLLSDAPPQLRKLVPVKLADLFYWRIPDTAVALGR
ncbi:MAG: alpha/beta fold hydrolase [Acidobacteriaceae bacterium]|nr:alpha/beta fold hydrolase [Acidobacteriaceae bacterium]